MKNTTSLYIFVNMYWLLYRLILCITSKTFTGFFLFYQEQNVPPGSKLFLTLKQELTYSAGFFRHVEVTYLYMDVTVKLYSTYRLSPSSQILFTIFFFFN